MLRAAFSFGLALMIALYTTPLMRRAAIQFGILDRPNALLKTHAEPVPYLGGLAVFLAYLIATAVTFEFGLEVLGILLAGTLMLLVGLIDDLGVLSPWEKLGGQCIAVATLIKAGLYVKLVFLSPFVALVLSIFWLLTMTNALNIIDVMDGLASGVAAIAALFLAGVAIQNGEPMVAAMASALAGSLCGFLRYNLCPARIYLGDSGSLFIGLTLGALAMNGHYTKSNSLGMLVPAIILGIPLLDLAFVFMVRIYKRLSPFRGSPDHLALRLRRAGLTVRQTVALAYGVGAILGSVAFAIMIAPTVEAAAAVFVVLSSLLVASLLVLWRTTT